MSNTLTQLFDLAISKDMINLFKSEYPEYSDNEIKYIEWALEEEPKEVIEDFKSEYKTKISYHLNK